MTNVTIPELGPAVALSGQEQIEIVQGGQSMSATIGQIVLLALAPQNGGYAICSNRQFRSALAANSLEVTVDTAVSADIDNAITIQWRNGAYVVLNDGLSTFAQGIIGYTSLQMSVLFAQALTYPL